MGIAQPSGTTSATNVKHQGIAAIYTPFDLLNIMAATQNVAAMAAGALPTVKNALKFRTTRATSHFTITNQSTGHAVVTLYYCKPRFDLTDNVDAGTYDPLLTTVAASQAHLYANVSIAEATTGAAEAITNRLYSLYDTPIFTSRWVIYKVKKLYMHGGQVHYGSIRSGVEKSWDSQRWVGSLLSFGTNPFPSALKGHTKWVVMRVEGQPADDATTATNLGFSIPKVVYSTQNRYDYNYAPSTYQRSLTALAPLGEAAVSSAKIITEFGQTSAAEANS